MEQASDSAAPEEVQTSLVILASQERTVKATATFLTRRGIQVQVVTALNDAMDLLTKKLANIVLVSCNYPHPKIEMIPSLLAQSFSVPCIAFAEETDRKTTQRLGAMKTRHIMFGPVSGPSVLMRIRQIEKEASDAKLAAEGGDEKERAERSGSAESGDIKVGGGRSGSANGAIVLKGKKSGSAGSEEDNSVETESGEDEEGSVHVAGKGLQRSGETYVQKGTRSGLKSAIESGPTASDGATPTPAEAMKAAIENGLSEVQPQDKPKLLVPPPRPAGKSNFAIEKRTQGPGGKELDAASPGAAPTKSLAESLAEANREAAEKNAAEMAEAKEKAERKAVELEAKKKEAAERAREHAELENAKRAKAKEASDKLQEENAKKAKLHEEEEKKKKAIQLEEEKKVREKAAAEAKLRQAHSEEEALMIRFIREAVVIVCGATTSYPEKSGDYTAFGLIVLKSKRIEGSAMIALSTKSTRAQDLLQRIELAFFSLVRDAGIELDQGEQFSIELDDRETVERVFAGSDYVLRMKNDVNEVGLAIVHVENPEPVVEPAGDSMLKILAREIPTDLKLTFEVFIHMPWNKKFIRYLKVGSKLLDRQATGFEKFHIEHLFLNEQDRDAYRKHYAANSIIPSAKKKPGSGSGEKTGS